MNNEMDKALNFRRLNLIFFLSTLSKHGVVDKETIVK